MKKSLIILTLSITVLLSGCAVQKYKSLESKNKQLLHQIDSLNILLENERRITLDFTQKEKVRNELISKLKVEESKLKALMASSPSSIKNTSNSEGVTHGTSKDNALIIVDGILFKGELSDIPIEEIQSLSVKKYSAAYDKYGVKDKDKVIEVATKAVKHE
jgi:hypothetical protein